MRRRFLLLISALVLLSCMIVPANAHEVPDASRAGSISVTMKYDGKPVPGGELTLYKVGDVAENDGDYSFAPTAEFAGCVDAFTDISSPALANTLAAYAKSEWSIAKETAGSNGKVKFSGLEIGLYLVVQTKTAENYEAIDPFLVSVPRYLEGKYVYDVDATSKMSLITYNPPPETTVPPTTPGPDLPQTGQLNWPVPVLAASGLLLFTLGWMLRGGRKKETNEE